MSRLESEAIIEIFTDTILRFAKRIREIPLTSHNRQTKNGLKCHINRLIGEIAMGNREDITKGKRERRV